MFYLFSESNVALKTAVSLPSPEALETGQAEGYLPAWIFSFQQNGVRNLP